MLSAPDPDSRGVATGRLVDACGLEPNTICEWTYDRTGSEGWARLADWFIGRPLAIILILLAAWLIARLARRAVVGAITRFILRDRSLPRRGLRKLGIEPPELLVGSDSEDAERRLRAESRATSISSVLGGTVVVLVWGIALTMVVDELGVALGPLIASAGIVGVALGFGAQSLVKDCLSGLFILMEDQYGVGDVVDLGEATGAVEEIALRTTVLRGLDGTVWHVPNGEITRVGNMSQLWSVALVDVDVAYDTDLTRAEDLVLATATEVCVGDEWAPDIVEAPTLLGVERLGADGITLRLVVKCSPGSQWALQRELRKRIKDALDADGIEIPFPQRTLWIRNDDT